MGNIRLYSTKDCEAIVALFYNTVHEVNTSDYDKEQLDAWAPSKIDIDRWCAPLSSSYSLVYVDASHIIGFGNMTDEGVLDRLYVDYQHQGEGIGSLLLDKLENYAASQGIKTISAHVSITARHFFERHGYNIKKEQIVERNNIQLTNYLMEKNLNI